MNCVGTELNIKDSSHNGRGIEDCHHGGDAGVQCLNGKVSLSTVVLNSEDR